MDIVDLLLPLSAIVYDKSNLLFIPVFTQYQWHCVLVLVSLIIHYLITWVMTTLVSVCRQQNASVGLYVIIRTDTFVGKFHES